MPENKTTTTCTSAFNDTSTKIHELNSDILTRIFEEVSIQNRNEIAIFKSKYDKFIHDKGYGDIDFTNAELCLDLRADTVHDWIYNYIKNLSQNQINSILCDYGINKALQLKYDYHIGMGDSNTDFCEELLLNPADKEMVELIFLNEAKFLSG
jgi:hypothetical protein